MCGATGGVMLWLAVYPFDVIKSRSQIQSGPRSSIYSTTVTILKHEGQRTHFLSETFIYVFKSASSRQGIDPQNLWTILSTSLITFEI